MTERFYPAREAKLIVVDGVYHFRFTGIWRVRDRQHDNGCLFWKGSTDRQHAVDYAEVRNKMGR